jgi:hypothetical protein
MSVPRYLVAKYVPDPLRMEPRNIGVVVWADGQIGARFLGENGSETSRIRVPSRLHVSDRRLYEQWIRYWRQQMSMPALSRGPDGMTAGRETPEFLEALASKSQLGYMLVGGGIVRKEISPHELKEVVADLFETLVLEERDRKEHPAEHESELLRRACHDVIRQSRIRERPDFQEEFPYPGLAKGVQRTFRFNYALYEDFGRKPPKAVFQRVLLTNQNSVYSAAFMFECMAKENHLSKENCAALVYTAPSALEQQEIRESLALMRECGKVINLHDPAMAVSEFLTIGA